MLNGIHFIAIQLKNLDNQGYSLSNHNSTKYILHKNLKIPFMLVRVMLAAVTN